MPELPEVETIKRDLSRLIVGRKILAITTDSPKQVQPSLAVVKKAVIGATIKKITRRAKLLQIFLSNNEILAVHLKLTGRLLVREKGAPQDDWQRVVISLSGNKELRFADLRKFGWIRVIGEMGEMGPEPFSKEFTVDYLGQVLAKSSRPVKLVLMDQKKIAGVGNIYANEALFLAKTRPNKPAKKLSSLEIKKLRGAIIKVLKAGIKYRGASDQYYLDALGHKGSYQDHFLVYNREGKKCFDCGGKIKKIKLGGRGTFFCPKCQR